MTIFPLGLERSSGDTSAAFTRPTSRGRVASMAFVLSMSWRDPFECDARRQSGY